MIPRIIKLEQAIERSGVLRFRHRLQTSIKNFFPKYLTMNLQMKMSKSWCLEKKTPVHPQILVYATFTPHNNIKDFTPRMAIKGIIQLSP